MKNNYPSHLESVNIDPIFLKKIEAWRNNNWRIKPETILIIERSLKQNNSTEPIKQSIQ